MNFFKRLFPSPRRLPEIKHAPPGANWRSVRPRAFADSVSARLADKDGAIETGRGRLQFRRGRDYLVEHAPGDVAVVERDTFMRTYRLSEDGRYKKRTDVTYRFFQLPHAVTVRTDEGPQRAEPNDWIIEGLHGEIWPVHQEDARKIYEII